MLALVRKIRETKFRMRFYLIVEIFADGSTLSCVDVKVYGDAEKGIIVQTTHIFSMILHRPLSNEESRKKFSTKNWLLHIFIHPINIII